jgi:hypothetical protein
MRKFSLILLAMLALGIIGCTIGLSKDYAILKTPPPAQYDDKMATVVFLRRWNLQNSAVGYYIWSNGEKVCALDNGTYCIYRAKPGNYTFFAQIGGLGHESTGNERQLSIEAGKTYYVASSIAFKYDPTFVLMPESVALPIIKKLKYLQLNK